MAEEIKRTWHHVPFSQKGIDFLAEGKMREVFVNDQRILMVRFKDQIYAVQNRCPHNRAPMRGGELTEEGCITCPLHRYKFDIKTGKNTTGEGYYLENWPVELREDGFHIGFEKPSKLFGLF